MTSAKYAVDSRLVQKGTVFFALKGVKTDGHLYLKEAFDKGAIRAYVSKSYTGDSFGLELSYVEDPLAILQEMAQTKIGSHKPLIIGVTGSYAKTTTKEGLARAFSEKVSVFKTPGNQNSQVGLPLAILNSYQGEPYVILEMGIENPGDMEQLVRIAKPDVAVVTRIAQAHLETLFSLEKIAYEKGKIVVPGITRYLFVHASCQEYYKEQNYPGTQITLYDSVDEELFSDIRDLVQKLAALLAISANFVPFDPPKWRFEKKEYPYGTVMLDCYNANPSTMRFFFRMLQTFPHKGRKVAILGQMAALGPDAEEKHAELAHDLHPLFDVAFCVGQNLKGAAALLQTFGKQVFWVQSVEELMPLIFQEIKNTDTVFVKGSNMNRLWEVEPWLSQVMDV
jgi:UDP-N-acetylmuramoyl-tripeptide--D-alanyl-D-alanine ligase